MEELKHRTQISIEHWQYQILLDISRKKKESLSSIIRELLTEKFSKEIITSKNDPLWKIVGTGAGDGSSVARNHDMYLYTKEKKGKKC